MHHFLVRNLGILVFWMIPTFLVVGHGIFTLIARDLLVSYCIIMCIRHITTSMSWERHDEVRPHPLEMYFMMDGLLLIHPYLEDAYFMMDSLSMFWDILEEDMLPFNLHNLVIES